MLEALDCTFGTAATRGHASGAARLAARNPAVTYSPLNPCSHTLAKGMEEGRRQRETGQRRLCQRDSSPLAACWRARPSGAVQVLNVPSCALAWHRLIPPREPAAAEPQKGASPAPFLFPGSREGGVLPGERDAIWGAATKTSGVWEDGGLHRGLGRYKVREPRDVRTSTAFARHILPFLGNPGAKSLSHHHQPCPCPLPFRGVVPRHWLTRPFLCRGQRVPHIAKAWAAICLLLNIFLPGVGSMVAGIMVNRPTLNPRGSARARGSQDSGGEGCRPAMGG